MHKRWILVFFSDQKSILAEGIKQYLRSHTRARILHAYVSPGSGASASGQVGNQDDHNEQDQGASDGNRNDVRRVDGIAVLGNRELGVLFVVERLELQLGDGHGRSGVITRGQVELLGPVAVVGHVRRGLE